MRTRHKRRPRTQLPAVYAHFRERLEGALHHDGRPPHRQHQSIGGAAEYARDTPHMHELRPTFLGKGLSRCVREN